ncbi:hypothetical protein A9404_12320 [Halothiobacillus diazotrophicus]|uniref:CdiI immunity protein domain-containing protein n=1 Tax=Halothiobacillus diazotrophicus TaxID=1860122 RepID=A0A191ZJP2_9GAMM|nr:contact-dependent growth inhibition system immunity protein [Halothiobacillus diazotrophicus]ANJ68053.1 hypothetical protein A9404_12320 [Halothiobacillus diazotrophicus]
MAEQNRDLEQLFDAYFHQDWAVEHASWQAVAEQFVADSNAPLPEYVATKLSELSESPISDCELSQAVQAMGCYYWPGSEHGYRSWLQQLAVHLQVAAAANNSSKRTR